MLTVNSKHVVAESIDGEVILIHLGTGTYYSLDGVGAELWSMLAEGVAPDAAGERVAAGYADDPALVADAVRTFLEQLQAEGLVIEASIEIGVAEAAPAVPLAPDGPPERFIQPTLNRYTDLQDFLLADPLHDVDEQAGWPHVRAG